jgi:hypothetical protein
LQSTFANNSVFSSALLNILPSTFRCFSDFTVNKALYCPIANLPLKVQNQSVVWSNGLEIFPFDSLLSPLRMRVAFISNSFPSLTHFLDLFRNMAPVVSSCSGRNSAL